MSESGGKTKTKKKNKRKKNKSSARKSEEKRDCQAINGRNGDSESIYKAQQQQWKQQKQQ